MLYIYQEQGEQIIDDSYLKTKEARVILDGGYKILQYCEVLRKQRDLAGEKREYWKLRYYKLKNGNNEQTPHKRKVTGS